MKTNEMISALSRDKAYLENEVTRLNNKVAELEKANCNLKNAFGVFIYGIICTVYITAFISGLVAIFAGNYVALAQAGIVFAVTGALEGIYELREASGPQYVMSVVCIVIDIIYCSLWAALMLLNGVTTPPVALVAIMSMVDVTINTSKAFFSFGRFLMRRG